MEPVFYVAGKRSLLTGKIDLEKDPLCLALLTSKYVPDALAHKTYNDLTHEAKGQGYEAGGVRLTGPRLVEHLGEIHLHADAVRLERSTLAAAGAAVYLEAAGTLLVFVPFSPQESLDADFLLEWGDDGILWI